MIKKRELVLVGGYWCEEYSNTYIPRFADNNIKFPIPKHKHKKSKKRRKEQK